MSHDIEQAKRFLTLLDETETNFTFQTFDDKQGKNPALAKWMHGDIESLFNDLVNYNKLGAGVFVMVQGGDGTGRNIKAVNKIRCVFNENDNGMPKKQPLEPQIVVESSPGKFHYYFLTDGLELDDFKPIQGRLIADYGSDPNAHDLPRVLRVPGFYHNKKEPFLVKITHESGALPYKKEQIVSAFPPYVKPVIEHKDQPVINQDKLSLELRSALMYLRSDDRHSWVKIGHALHELGDIGRGLWLEWSAGSDKFDMAEACEKWEGFHHDNIGYKHVFAEAQKNGWVNIAKKVTDYKLPSELIETHDDERLKITFSSADEMADTATAPVFFINNVLEQDSHGMLAGSSGAYKSFMVLNMAHSICTGGMFFRNQCFDTGKVLYFCGEGEGALKRRMKALKIVCGGFSDNLLVSDVRVRIDSEDDVRDISLAIQKIRPALVIFDTFSSMNSRTNENDNSDVSKALSFLKSHVSNGYTSSIIVHHYGKDSERGVRGASAFKDNSDFIFTMKRTDKETMQTTLSCEKLKDGEPFSDISAMARVVELGFQGQDGKESTSLVLDDVNYKPRGRPGGSHDKDLWVSLEEAIVYDARITKVGTGCSRDTFYKIAKKTLGESGVKEAAAFKAIKKFIEDEETSKKLLIFNDNIKETLIDRRFDR